MTDQELRQLVRDAIARRGAGEAFPPLPSAAPGVYPSHGKFSLLRSGDEEGACVIEPSVRCNHCGYCLSYGH